MTIDAFFAALESAPIDEEVGAPPHELYDPATAEDEAEFAQRFPKLRMPQGHVELLRRHNGALLGHGWISLHAWVEIDSTAVTAGAPQDYPFPETWVSVATGQDGAMYALIDTETGR